MFVRLVLLLAVVTLAACASDPGGSGPDRVVPPNPSASPPVLAGEGDRHAALVAALDTLEALVVTLERVQDPISAWNHAADVSRLLNALERDRASYALNMDEDDAAKRYPREIDRLKNLETRRDIELNRIMSERVIARVLVDEMNKAEAEAEADAEN